jgi:hypothetical protein
MNKQEIEEMVHKETTTSPFDPNIDDVDFSEPTPKEIPTILQRQSELIEALTIISDELEKRLKPLMNLNSPIKAIEPFSPKEHNSPFGQDLQVSNN